MGLETTQIQQHGAIASAPSEIIGQGEVLLRIGNGGAGGTGLVQARAKDYLSSRKELGSITWVCNHSRNTQLALLRGHIDIALTYEREQEEIAVSEGWAESAGCIFHDHFCLVGPEHDPANIEEACSVEEAFEKIYFAQALFYSRCDGSATMSKEREIWRRCHLSPWVEASNWYTQFRYAPADAIKIATSLGAYILNDRSTLLNQIRRGAIAHCAVFFEPTDRFHPLMNSCYALHKPLGHHSDNMEIPLFLRYLKSERAQNIIAAYGASETGSQLFAPIEDGIASSKIVGGRVIDGKWVLREHLSSRL